MVTPDDRDMRARELELLQSLVDEALADAEPQVRKVIEQGVPEKVFDVAWEHQFERDRAPARRAIREIVQEAAAEVVEPDAD